MGCLTLSRTDRQDAEVTVLIGEMAIELGAGLAAVMQVDVGALGGTVTCAEELAIGRCRRAIAP